MLTIAEACPRCLEPHTVFHVVYQHPCARTVASIRREVTVVCTHCEQLAIAVLDAPGAIDLISNPAVNGDSRKYPDISVSEIHPDMPANEAPEHVPEQVADAYEDGLKILQSRMWTPAAGSFRTALDRATKLLWRSSQGNDKWPKELSPRIQELKVKLDLPKAIADWAHQVRIVGNEMHDIDDVKEEDARDAAHFAELFLTYTFTLPMRLEEFRARRAGS